MLRRLDGAGGDWDGAVWGFNWGFPWFTLPWAKRTRRASKERRPLDNSQSRHSRKFTGTEKKAGEKSLLQRVHGTAWLQGGDSRFRFPEMRETGRNPQPLQAAARSFTLDQSVADTGRAPSLGDGKEQQHSPIIKVARDSCDAKKLSFQNKISGQENILEFKKEKCTRGRISTTECRYFLSKSSRSSK